MYWEKLGRIYEPKSINSKLKTHAANPVAMPLIDDVYRIYFSGRDDGNRSSVGYFDFDMDRMECVKICDKEVFSFGPDDSFYSHGVSIGCSQQKDGENYLLFMGWHIPANAHWQGEIGRLRLVDGEQGVLDPKEPLLEINAHDPISLSYPWIYSGADGTSHMIYGSTQSWDSENGEMIHILRQAISENADDWLRLNADLPWAIGEAQAFSRPTILLDSNDRLQMWFSYRSGRGETYRIGYAEGHAGQSWQLKLAESGIDVSAEGWDSEMIEYPFVFNHAGDTYMLYNGNGYGQSGIGLARLVP